MTIHSYDPKKDKDAIIRIWREVGWAEKDKEEQVTVLLEACRTFVAEIDGTAECAVTESLTAETQGAQRGKNQGDR